MNKSVENTKSMSWFRIQAICNVSGGVMLFLTNTVSSGKNYFTQTPPKKIRFPARTRHFGTFRSGFSCKVWIASNDDVVLYMWWRFFFRTSISISLYSGYDLGIEESAYRWKRRRQMWSKPTKRWDALCRISVLRFFYGSCCWVCYMEEYEYNTCVLFCVHGIFYISFCLEMYAGFGLTQACSI